MNSKLKHQTEPGRQKTNAQNAGKSSERQNQVQALPPLPETNEQLFAREIVTKAAERYLLEFDNKENPVIQSVGLKWRKDRHGNPEAVVGFFIRPGKDPKNLAQPIPTRIELSDLGVKNDHYGNTFRITSVVTRTYYIRDICKLANNPNRATDAQPAPQPIIQPGEIVLGHPNEQGSIGLLIRRKNTAGTAYMSGIYLLSAAHVIAGNSYSTSTTDDESEVYQPEIGGRTVIGRLWRVDEAADFALAKLVNNPGRDIDSFIKGIGKPSAPGADIQTGDLLKKSGRTTKVTSGIVTFSTVISRLGDGSVSFDYSGFAINPNVGGVDPQVPPLQPFADNGDSGAIVVKVSVNSEGKTIFSPVGILLEIYVISGTTYYIALKLTDILNKNNVRGEMYVKPEPEPEG